MTTTRRRLFQTAAIAGTALAAPQIMTRAALAQGAGATPQPAAFDRFMIGAFEVTVLLDGRNVAENPQAVFGTDQTVEAVESLLVDNFLPTGRMVLPFAPTLVDTGDEVILFDTGLGEGARAGGLGLLSANMRAAGRAPEDVTIVVLTHMHPDHIGGLLEAGAPAFPNARYVTGQVEYDFWTTADLAGTPGEGTQQMVSAMVVPLAAMTTFISPGDDVVSGITAVQAFGHTPGHMAYRIESGGEALMLTADTANHFVLSMQRPDWEVLFDIDKAAAAATRRSLLGMIADERIPFVGYHMPFPSVGYLEALGDGFRFVPETYQLAP